MRIEESNSSPPKPVAEQVRPEITRLPQMTAWRRLVRRAFQAILRLAAWLLTDTQVNGLENIPPQGAALIVSNHLGDADLALGIAFTTRLPEVLSKAELHDFPMLGWLMEAYGVIWVHRGQPDRRAMRAALRGLAENRLVTLAPEGRESVTGALEEGTHGAAYLALKANVPLVPVTFTGTENSRLLTNIKRLRRTAMTITIGPPFRLEPDANWRAAIERGTQVIMRKLAMQLPPEYRGVYSFDLEETHGSR